MQEGRPVHALPAEVVAQLRSSVCTPSLALCVEELVANSLDAGATCIAVRVDLESLRLQVVDNGHGVSCEDLRSIGERYATSKCYSLEDLQNISFFGYRGEFLSSLRGISTVLEIVSRPKTGGKTFSKLFRKGELCELCPAKEERPTHGTTVTAYNVYYNLPVRQKKVKAALDLEKIRRSLEAFALVHHNISFSLRDDHSGSKLLQTHSTQSPKSAFGFLFGHAKSKKLREVTYSHKKFAIRGHFGVDCHVNNHLQFVYVNKRVVVKTKIQKLLKRCLSHSLLFKSQRFEKDSETPSKHDVLSLCDQSSPSRRGCGEFPVYVLEIHCLRSEYDILPDASQTFLEFHDWPGLSTCVERVVRKFLVEENLLLSTSQEDEDGAKDKSLLADESSEEILDPKALPRPPVPSSSLEKLQKYGYSISTKNCSNNLHSKVVTRSHLSASGSRKHDNHGEGSSVSGGSNFEDKKGVRGQKRWEGDSLHNKNMTPKWKASSSLGESKEDEDDFSSSSGDESGTHTHEKSPDNEKAQCEGYVEATRLKTTPSLLDKNSFNSRQSVNVEKGKKKCSLGHQNFGTTTERNKRASEMASKSLAVPQPEEMSITLTSKRRDCFAKNRHHISDPVCFAQKTPFISSPDEVTKRNKSASPNHIETPRIDEKVSTVPVKPGLTAKESHKNKISSVEHRRSETLEKVASISTPSSPCSLISSFADSLMVGDQSVQSKAQEPALDRQENVKSSCPPHHSSEEDHRKTAASSGYVSSLQRFKQGLRSSPGHMPVNLASKISLALSNKSHKRGPGICTTDISQRKTRDISKLSSCRFPEHEQDLKGEREDGVLEAEDRFLSGPLPPKMAGCQARREEDDEVLLARPSSLKEVGLEEKVVHNRPALPVDVIENKDGRDKKTVAISKSCQTRSSTVGETPCSTFEEQRLPHLAPGETFNKEKEQNLSIPERILSRKDWSVSSTEKVTSGARSPPPVQRRNFHQDFLFLDPHFRKDDQKLSRPFKVKRSLSGESAVQDAKHKKVEVCPREDSNHSAKWPSFMSTSSFVLTARDLLPQMESSTPKPLDQWVDKSKLPKINCSVTENGIARQHDNGRSSAGFMTQTCGKLVCHSETAIKDVPPSVGHFGPSDMHREFSSEVTNNAVSVRCLEHRDIENDSCGPDCCKENRYPAKGKKPAELLKLSPRESTAVSEEKHQEVLAMLDSSPFCSFPPVGRNTGTISSEASQLAPSQSLVFQGHHPELVLSTQPFDVVGCLGETAGSAASSCNSRRLKLTGELRSDITTQPIDTSSVQSPSIDLNKESENLALGGVNDQALMEPKHDVNGSQSNASGVKVPAMSSQLSQRTQEDLEALSEEDILLLTVIEEASSPPSSIGEKLRESDRPDGKLAHCPFNDTDKMSEELSRTCESVVKQSEYGGVTPSIQEDEDKLPPTAETTVVLTRNHNFAPEEHILQSTAPGEGGDHAAMAAATVSNTGSSSRAEASKMQSSTSVPRFIKYSKEASVPFYKRDQGQKDSKDAKGKVELWKKEYRPEVVDGPHSMSRDASDSVPWELYWFLPKSAKDFFPRPVQDRQGSSAGGEDGAGVDELIDSHIASTDEEDKKHKWKDQIPEADSESRKSLDELFNNWQNPVFEAVSSEVLDTSVTQALSATIKAHNSLHPYQFSKAIFNSIQVIGQVDNKFIICRADPSFRQLAAGERSLLILVDQHAAHERIRLERLVHDAYHRDLDREDDHDDERQQLHAGSHLGSCLRSSSVIPPIPIGITREERRLAQAFSDKLAKLGVEVIFRRSGKDQQAEVRRLPACLVEREANMIKKAKQPVATDLAETLVQESIHLLQETAGSCTILPKTIVKALNSQACRGAIKFGDALNREDMLCLLSQLAECNLPFQCAHGRPSIIPLLDLVHLVKKLNPQETRKPNLANLGPKNPNSDIREDAP